MAPKRPKQGGPDNQSLDFARDYDIWPQAEPDEIEQQVISTISTIPAWASAAADNRSYVKRVFDELGPHADAVKDRAAKEQWTKEIGVRLVEVGQSLGYRAYRNWMYDVIWCDSTWSDWNYTHGIPLVLQCTWSQGADGYPGMGALDMLLVARADHRVMICQHNHFKNTFERLASTVEDSRITQRGDRYLLLFFDRVAQKFESGVYIAGTTRRDE